MAKAKSSSSNRQKAAFMKSAVTARQSSLKSQRNKRKRALKKAKKQGEALIRVKIPLHKLTTTNLTVVPENMVFVDRVMDRNSPIHPQLTHVEKNPNKQVTVLPVSTF